MVEHIVHGAGLSTRTWIVIGAVVAVAVLVIAALLWVRAPVPPEVPKFGRFDPTRPQLILLEDGRTAELIADFTYIDGKKQSWRVPKGWRVDGASIPQALWTVVGGPFEGKYRYASIVHDYYCDQPQGVAWEDVHKMYYEACVAGGYDDQMAGWMFALVYRGGPKWPLGVISRRENGASPLPLEPIAAVQAAIELETQRFAAGKAGLVIEALTTGSAPPMAATAPDLASIRISSKSLAKVALEEQLPGIEGTVGGTVAVMAPTTRVFQLDKLDSAAARRIDSRDLDRIKEITERDHWGLFGSARRRPPTAESPSSPPSPHAPMAPPTTQPATDLQVITLTDSPSSSVLLGAAPAEGLAQEIQDLNRVKQLLKRKPGNEPATSKELEDELNGTSPVP
jgi:hypothetical protein